MIDSRKLIDSILSGDAMEMENEFNSIMGEKVALKLEAFRKEVGQGMFNESTEPTDEQILEDLESLFEFANEADKALFQYVKNTSRSFKQKDPKKKSLKDRILGLIKGKSKLTKEQVEFIESALEESVGGSYKKDQKSHWETAAKERGLTVKPTVDDEGESGKSWKAVDKHGNHRGSFHIERGGKLHESEELDEAKGKLGYTPKHTKFAVMPKSRKEFAKFFPLDKESEAKSHAEITGGKLVKIDQAGRVIKESEELDEEIKIGDHVHIGHMVKGGAGVSGKVKKIEGN